MGYVVQASSSWLRGPISTLLMIAVCASGGSAQDPGTPPSASIQGRVVDTDTGEPIAGAGVALDGTSLRALTDGQGRFTLASVPSGIYTVRVSQVAFEQLVRSDVRVVTGASVDLNLSMSAVVFELGEIVVTPGAFSFMDAGSAGRQTMSRTEIESVPQFGEDIFRAVNRFPGLSGGDYSAQFSIRGGRPDETLIVLDGLEIYEPYHMKDFADGAISILDVETIDGVELLTGGFPVDYGNRLSGVFNVTSRRPAPDSTRYSLGMSLVNARAMAQGTFGDGKGSWFVSGRRGYLDLLFKVSNTKDLPIPAYYDAFSTLRYDFNPRHSLAVHALHAGDAYDFSTNATTGMGDTIDTTEFAQNKYGNSYVWATLQSSLGDRVVVRSLASWGLVTADRVGDESYVTRPDPLYSVSNTRDFTTVGFKQDWSVDLARAWFMRFGADVKAQDVTYNHETFVGQDPDDPSPDPRGFFPVRSGSALNKSGTLFGAYLANRFRLADPLTVELGLRYDRASFSGDSDVSPRAHAVLDLGAGSNSYSKAVAASGSRRITRTGSTPGPSTGSGREDHPTSSQSRGRTGSSFTRPTRRRRAWSCTTNRP